MPISSFYGLQTSLRGLLAQQRSLDTTAHNISNASTPGYSRQEAVLAASPATDIPAGMLQNGGGAQLGSGVDVQAYRRIRDNFLDLQYRGQFTALSEQQARSDSLQRVELTSGEPGDTGINTLLGEYWNAWSDLADAPDEQAAQSALLQKSASLADAFSAFRSQLVGAQQDAQAEYDDLTQSSLVTGVPGEIESTAREIANLNDTIMKFTTAGDIPNDLMDKRDMLLDKLAGYGQTSITHNADGSVDVVFGGDVTSPKLVQGSSYSWSGSPAWAPGGPGGRLGGLLSLASPTGGAVRGSGHRRAGSPGRGAGRPGGRAGRPAEPGLAAGGDDPGLYRRARPRRRPGRAVAHRPPRGPGHPAEPAGRRSVLGPDEDR